MLLEVLVDELVVEAGRLDGIDMLLLLFLELEVDVVLVGRLKSVFTAKTSRADAPPHFSPALPVQLVSQRKPDNVAAAVFRPVPQQQSEPFSTPK